MINKEQILKFSWDVNDLLSQYVVIHDDIFKTSIRHVIPIPGIFKAIDFESRLTKVKNIISELKKCDSEIGFLIENTNEQEREYFDLLSKYVSALIETVSYLKIVVGTLYAKSQKFADSNYDWKNYKSDLARYKQSVRNYLVIGEQLNEFFEKIKYG